MKSITQEEATQTLEKVRNSQDEINRRSAKDYVPWIGWGLFVILFWPPFDYLNPNVWGIITWVAAIIGSVITSLYFARRKARIKSQRVSPKLSWLGYILWIAVGSAFAILTQSHFHYAWTVAGIVTGLPFVLYGFVLKSRV
jgi:hypothetical protein